MEAAHSNTKPGDSPVVKYIFIAMHEAYSAALFISHALDAMSFLLVRRFESEMSEKCPGSQIRHQVGGEFHCLHDKRLPG